MGKTCICFFMFIYRIAECKAKSKNEGLQLLRYRTKKIFFFKDLKI